MAIGVDSAADREVVPEVDPEEAVILAGDHSAVEAAEVKVAVDLHFRRAPIFLCTFGKYHLVVSVHFVLLSLLSNIAVKTLQNERTRECVVRVCPIFHFPTCVYCQNKMIHKF